MHKVVTTMENSDVPEPPQELLNCVKSPSSNIDRPGYEANIARLKEHIHNGNIIRAMPSQRMARQT